MSKPYKGKSVMAHRYEDMSSPEQDVYDIFRIRHILERLGKSEHLAQIEKRLDEAALKAQE